MWAVVEIAPVASVEPFGIPSKSIGQLRGNRTFVGRVVLHWSQVFPFGHVGCILSKSIDYGDILLRPGGKATVLLRPWAWRVWLDMISLGVVQDEVILLLLHRGIVR
ncbi:hypothetical protein HID58_048376 [Brassica napus]|uniref:Uncharacterized protein n=1 Tax=Brassica napus TaxID=3708 RepID=A0ABQ8B2Y9_BRANA|nr:hypothetical protein HID58_048376 [Brassica napus]